MLISFGSICVEQDWACASETFTTETIFIFLFSVDNSAAVSPVCQSAEEKALDFLIAVLRCEMSVCLK